MNDDPVLTVRHAKVLRDVLQPHFPDVRDAFAAMLTLVGIECEQVPDDKWPEALQALVSLIEYGRAFAKSCEHDGAHS